MKVVHTTSPLSYRGGRALRLALVDPDVEADEDDRYFNEPGLVAFLDYHYEPNSRWAEGNDYIYMDYANVRPDFRRTGLGKRLYGELLKKYGEDALYDFGKIMNPAVFRMYRQLQRRGLNVTGKNYDRYTDEEVGLKSAADDPLDSTVLERPIIASAHRVARRFMAGLFEPPPRVLKAVEDWSISVYAGHVLALVEQMLDGKPGDDEKRLAQTQKYLSGSHLYDKLEDKLEDMWRKGRGMLRIPAGTDHDVLVIYDDPHDDHDGRVQITKVRKGERSKLPRRPKNMYSGGRVSQKYWDWLDTLTSSSHAEDEIRGLLERGLQTYSKGVRRNVRQRMNPERLVELEVLRRECKKYTSKAKAYKSSARTVLPIDLSGWKYLDGMSASEVEQKQVETGFTTFTCILHFKPHKRRGGQWSPGDMRMELDLWSGMNHPNKLKAFREGIQRLRNISRHETIHLGQTALMKVKDLAGWSAGYPSRDLQEEDGSEYIRGKRLPHPRRSVEFYPRLADEVSEFAVEIKKIPMSKRRSFLRDWFTAREFFRENKRNPGKWEKMVGEFIAAIGEAGIKIPSDTPAHK